MNLVVAYSLFAGPSGVILPKYLYGALRNAEAIRWFYPGWRAVFFTDDKVPEATVNLLHHFDAFVMRMSWDPEREVRFDNVPPMMWRFLVNEIVKGCDRFVSRDCDSRLSPRESLAVEKWMESEKALHIMRDHPNHSGRMGGGMWGVKTEKLKEPVSELISKWAVGKENKDLTNYDMDQAFLESSVLSLFSNEDILLHDSTETAPDWAQTFPSKKVGIRFVGEIWEEDKPKGA